VEERVFGVPPAFILECLDIVDDSNVMTRVNEEKLYLRSKVSNLFYSIGPWFLDIEFSWMFHGRSFWGFLGILIEFVSSD